ncbi:MAG: DUF5361 domain-containing protein [Bacillota bacterium]|nr:DUF5361 domain-containing protein [Bacillota bacterium]
MIKLDEDALISDLAETYQIYDYQQLPLTTVAAFSCNLRNDSRIKLKMNQQAVPINTQVLMGILDAVNLLLWSRSKDAERGAKRPQSILDAVMGNQKKQVADSAVTFDSGEDFERIRNRLITGGEPNGD